MKEKGTGDRKIDQDLRSSAFFAPLAPQVWGKLN
jgi:hypothetical protein